MHRVGLEQSGPGGEQEPCEPPGTCARDVDLATLFNCRHSRADGESARAGGLSLQICTAFSAERSKGKNYMESNLFKYVWRHSKIDQIWTLLIVVVSMPFVFYAYELPKLIVNGPISGTDIFQTPGAVEPFLRLAFELPAWISNGGEFVLFEGIGLTRVPYLYALCGGFLALVCVNGLFKYYINTYKGRVGERMLRRVRYELLDRVLRFPQAQFRRIRAPEMATMVKDEVEPLGTFIGDAFVTPVFQGGLALVAMFFIVSQNVILGLVSLGVVLGQALIIPRLRRQLLYLSKQRQLESRALAGRVGELVDGIQEIHVNDASHYERADLAARLGRIFFIRYELYQRKYFIKFLNNFLAQFTPFLFYLVGGIAVIEGDLNLGQLIAVIAAYKDLPSPIRELINWDQQRLDVQIKYTQVIEQFDAENMIDPSIQEPVTEPVPPLVGKVVAGHLSVTDDTGARLLERTSFEVPIDDQTAVVGLINSGAETTSEVLARLMLPSSGRIEIGGKDLDEYNEAVLGRRLSYVGPDPYLVQGSVRDSLLYGLRHVPLRDPDGETRTPLQLSEAKRSGNTLLDISADWVDYEAAGVSGPQELDARILELLRTVDLADDLFELGLRGTINPATHPELAEQVMTARRALRERLEQPPLSELVEPFDPERYNHHATLAENLLFGTAVDDVFAHQNLASNTYFRKILTETKLDRELFSMGEQIARTVIELFSGLAEDHPFFEQLSFMSAEEIPDYEKLVVRISGVEFDKVKPEDVSMLLKLTFAYIEPRHRLGLMTEELEAQLLRARKTFADELPEDLQTAIEFYQPETYNGASSLQDNVLLGRVAYGIADAAEQVHAAMRSMLDELNLRDAVFEVGLQFNVGSGGKRLTSTQRQKLALARALLKRPDLLIVNRAFASLNSTSQDKMVRRVLEAAKGSDGQKGSGVYWVLQNPASARLFDNALVFEDGTLVESGNPDELSKAESKLAQIVELS